MKAGLNKIAELCEKENWDVIGSWGGKEQNPYLTVGFSVCEDVKEDFVQENSYHTTMHGDVTLEDFMEELNNQLDNDSSMIQEPLRKEIENMAFVVKTEMERSEKKRNISFERG